MLFIEINLVFIVFMLNILLTSHLGIHICMYVIGFYHTIKFAPVYATNLFILSI